MVMIGIVSMVLRVAELAFAAIVAGLIGEFLHSVQGSSNSWDLGRFIYTEVIAGLSIILAIIWLFPFSGSFIHWPADFIISVCWFAAFGLLVSYLNGTCGYVFDWSGIGFRGTNSCAMWKAAIAFCFLSAICWLASAILGIYWTRRHTTPAHADTVRRRRWYRSRV